MKAAARLLLLAGALIVGLKLFRAAPRDVALVYVLGDPLPESLEVEVLRDGTPVRRAVIRTWARRELRHAVRLPDGDYRLRFRLAGPRVARTVARPLQVREDGTVVIPLAE